MKTVPDKPYLTAKEVASLLMVSTNSIRVWTDKGLIKAETTLGGHRRFPRGEIERLLARHNGTAGPARLPVVLIIDDERDLAETLAEGLRQMTPGLKVDTAHDGFEGGFKASSLRPDVILLDLMMPGIDGFEVCRLLKREAATRHIRIVAMTGYPSDENVRNILAAGAERCLAKPLRLPALCDVLGLDPVLSGGNS